VEKTDKHPAFQANAALIQDLVSIWFGDVTTPTILLNRTGGMSRQPVRPGSGLRGS
jgi:hypothetical protein